MKHLPLFLLLIPFLSGCVRLGTFQSAKTIGKDKTEFHLGAGYRIHGFEPNLQFGFKKGARHNVDVGFTTTYMLGGSLLLLTDVKYQFLGDSASLFAVSSGFGIGIVLPMPDGGYGDGGTAGISFHFPVFFSVHPCRYFAAYISPRYVPFIRTNNYPRDRVGYAFGVTGGIKIGNRFGFFIERTRLFGKQNILDSQKILSGNNRSFPFSWQIGFVLVSRR